MDGGSLYRVDPASGEYRVLGDAGAWNTRLMAAVEGLLYTVEADGRLYWVHPDDGAWGQLGRDDWSTARALVGHEGGLVIDCGGEEVHGVATAEGAWHKLSLCKRGGASKKLVSHRGMGLFEVVLP